MRRKQGGNYYLKQKFSFFLIVLNLENKSPDFSSKNGIETIESDIQMLSLK
jgi:hypothetical protein